MAVLYAGFVLIVGFITASGLLAAIDPVRFVRLHNRLFGDPRDNLPRPWLAWLKSFDACAVQQSREMRLEYRLMGIGLMLFGAFILVSLLRNSK